VRTPPVVKKKLCWKREQARDVVPEQGIRHRSLHARSEPQVWVPGTHSFSKGPGVNVNLIDSSCYLLHLFHRLHDEDSYVKRSPEGGHRRYGEEEAPMNT